MRSLKLIIPVITILFASLSLADMAFAQQAQLNPIPSAPASDAPKAASPEVIEAERLSQQIRAEERLMDLKSHNLRWTPWRQIGQSTKDFVFKRDAAIANMIGDGYGVDVAAYDFNLNNKPEIILYFWRDCGFSGCLYKIYLDNEYQKPVNYMGRSLVPYRAGVMLDGQYVKM